MATGDDPGDSQFSFHGQAKIKGGLEECCWFKGSHGCCGRGRSALLVQEHLSLADTHVPAWEC